MSNQDAHVMEVELKEFGRLQADVKHLTDEVGHLRITVGEIQKKLNEDTGENRGEDKMIRRLLLIVATVSAAAGSVATYFFKSGGS